MDWLLLAATALLLAFAVALVMAYRRLDVMRHEIEVLTKRLAGQADDISGLCSAALSVDQRIANDEKRLGELFGLIESIKTQEKSHQPYHAAINLINSGADLEQLVAECGISREEAALLMRLHGAAASHHVR